MQLWATAIPKHVRFHDLRHTMATLLLNGGIFLAVAQKILRRSDPRLTANIYGHLNMDDMRAGLSKLDLGNGGRTILEIAPPLVGVGKSMARKGDRVRSRPSPAPEGAVAGCPVPIERLLFVRDVAEKLGLSTATVYKLCRLGELIHVRISGAVRIDPGDLERYITGKKEGVG